MVVVVVAVVVVVVVAVVAVLVAVVTIEVVIVVATVVVLVGVVATDCASFCGRVSHPTHPASMMRKAKIDTNEVACGVHERDTRIRW